MNSIKGDSSYHECISKANTSPFMYLSLFYFGQGILVLYSEGDSTELDLVKGYRKAQKCVTLIYCYTDHKPVQAEILTI